MSAAKDQLPQEPLADTADNPEELPQQVESHPDEASNSAQNLPLRFGDWWLRGAPEFRASNNLGLLGLWIRDLTHTTLWFAWTLEQRLTALKLLITTCGDTPYSTFGILVGVTAECRDQLKRYLGDFFAPVGSEELPVADVQTLLDADGISVRADEALFLNPPRAWEHFPEELLSEQFLTSTKCGHA